MIKIHDCSIYWLNRFFSWQLTTRYSLKRHEKCKEHLARLEKVGSGDEPSGHSGNHSGAQTSGGHSADHSGGGHSSAHSGSHTAHSGHSKLTPHLPPNLPIADPMSLSQAILMTSNGPSHLHETGYASHFMAHLT